MKKVVLVTGASSGIGKAIATYLHEKKFIVYGTSRNPDKTETKFTLIALDVTQKETIKTAVNKVLNKEGRVDVLINNAGKGITGSVEETPMEEIKSVFETNFFGAIQVIKEVTPIMRKQKNGLIINVTSIAGYMGLPFRAYYCASKGALELITEALRMEVKNFGIKVTNIAPGDFATNIAKGRYHTPVYKQSPYQKAYTTNLKLMDEHVDKGTNPVVIAKEIYKIITVKNPKIHYKSGSFLQKFSIFLKRILPDKWYEKLLINHYKL